MAYIRKVKNGFQAQVDYKTKRFSKTLPTKGEAVLWASKKLIEMRKIEDVGIDTTKTFEGVVNRYVQEVSSKKAGERWEKIRFNAIKEYEGFKDKKFSDINAITISAYRDARLKVVKSSTVNRELNLISGLFNVAIKEWRIVKENPVTQIIKPKNPPHRERLISDKEIEEFLAAAKYDPTKPAKTKSEIVAVAFLFAIESALRCGEICSLTKISINGSVAKLTKTKNGKPREVPLSKEALRLLTLLPAENDPLFGMTPAQIDGLFRKIRNKLKQTYTFHDSRHLAITRLAKKLDVLSLAKVVGHSNPKQLMTYFNPTADDLAKLLG